MNVGESGGQEVDLNLAPIIDCFTVLITFLLVSASFLTLNAIDVGIAANGEAPPELASSEPPVSMEVRVGPARSIEVRISGGPQGLDLALPVAAQADGQFDLVGLARTLEESKEKWPSVQDASVSADPGVRYKDLIRVIEGVKKLLPKVFISGS